MGSGLDMFHCTQSVGVGTVVVSPVDITHHINVPTSDHVLSIMII